MCKLLSGYAAMVDGTPRVWVSYTTDSHTEIAQEFNLRDLPHIMLFAWEFEPDTSKITPDVSAWRMYWDSDATFGCREKPPEDDAVEFRAAIERAAMRFVFTGDDTSSLKGWYFGRSQCHAPTGGSQLFYGNSQCCAPTGGSQLFYGNSQCCAPIGGRQCFYGNSQCYAPVGGEQSFDDDSECYAPACGAQLFLSRSRCYAPIGGSQLFRGDSRCYRKIGGMQVFCEHDC